jgi:arabinogalactan oligomer/maltooligosaccharide transport system substrate-binding protein
MLKPIMRSSATWAIVAVVAIIVVVAVGVYYFYSIYKPVTTSGVTITYWQAYSPQEYSAFITKILPAFEAQYPNIHVDITNVTLSTTNYATAAAAGNAPNVYYDSSNDEGNLYSGGLLVNLKNHINSTYFNSFAPGPLSSVSQANNTVVFGLPVNENGVLMYYNKHFFPNGIPGNTSALLADLTTLNQTQHVWGFAYGVGSTYGYRFAGWLPGFGGQLFQYKTYGAPTLNTSAMINALEFWYNVTYKDHINAPLGSGAGVSFATGLEGQLFETSKAAVMFDGPWDLVPLIQALGTNLGTAPEPMVSSTGQHFAPLLGATAIAVSSSQASGATAAQINASILFAQFLASPQAELWMYNGTGDLPSNAAALSSLITSANAGTLLPSFAQSQNLTASEFSTVEKGILQQMSGYTSPTPSTPQMNYYYSGLADMHTELGLYYTNKTITAQAVASCVQAFIASNGTTVLPSCS